MEPIKWPIAPDGYIPNSVIRSWGMKKKVLSQKVSWNDMIFHSHRLESTTNNKEDFKPEVFWYDDEEEEEADEEKTADVNRRRKEFVDEKNKKEAKTDVTRKEDKETKKEDEKHPQRKVEGQKEREEKKDRVDEKKEGKTVGTDLLKSSYNIQTKTGTLHYEEIKLERKDISSSSAKSANMHDGPMLFAVSKTQRPINNMISSKNIFSSSTSGHNTGAEDLTVLKQNMKLCDTNTPPLFSVSTRQRAPAALPNGPRIANDTSKLPQDWTCPPKMSSPSITYQSQLEFAPSGSSPVRDKMFLVSKEKNFTEQAVPTLDPKALKLFRKYKDTIKNSSHHGNITGKLHLNTGQNRSHTLKANLSSFPIQHHRIHPEFPDRSLYSGSLCHSVQPEHLSVHQRVVQKIQIKDTVKGTSTFFHHVIPMAAQNSFATLDLSGTTQYGRLQFDWIRGHEEDKLLEISGTKTKNTHCFVYHQSFVPS